MAARRLRKRCRRGRVQPRDRGAHDGATAAGEDAGRRAPVGRFCNPRRTRSGSEPSLSARELPIGDGPIVTSVGRLVARKGFDLVLRAVSGSARRFSRARPRDRRRRTRERPRLEALARELGIDAGIVLLPRCRRRRHEVGGLRHQRRLRSCRTGCLDGRDFSKASASCFSRLRFPRRTSDDRRTQRRRRRCDRG